MFALPTRPTSATIMNSTSDTQAATALKDQGNKAFAQHDWPKAIDFYSQAIEKYDKDPTFFSNRAQVGPTSPQNQASNQRNADGAVRPI